MIWAAPAICTFLLVFFVLHFRHLMRMTTANDLGEAAAYPWIVSFSDGVSGFVSYMTVLVLQPQPMSCCSSSMAVCPSSPLGRVWY